MRDSAVLAMADAGGPAPRTPRRIWRKMKTRME
jgi:hypothetical protein